MFLKLRYAMAGRPAREADAMTLTPIAPQGSTEPHGRPAWAQVETKLTRDRGSPQQSTSAPPAEGAKDLLGTLTPSCDSVTRRHRRNVQRRFSLSLLHHRIGEEEGDGVRLLVVVGASDALDCCSWRRLVAAQRWSARGSREARRNLVVHFIAVAQDQDSFDPF